MFKQKCNSFNPQKRHPESRPGEIWVTNVGSWEEFQDIRWQTKRPGVVAFDKQGRPIPGIPIFAEESELARAKT